MGTCLFRVSPLVADRRLGNIFKVQNEIFEMQKFLKNCYKMSEMVYYMYGYLTVFLNSDNHCAT